MPAGYYTSPSYSESACGRDDWLGRGRDTRMRQTHLHDRRVAFAALDELVIRQLSVLVPVHVAEDFVHPL